MKRGEIQKNEGGGRKIPNKLDKRLGCVDLGDCAAFDAVEQSAEHDSVAKKGFQGSAPVLEPRVARDLQQKRTRMLFVYCILVVGVIWVVMLTKLAPKEGIIKFPTRTKKRKGKKM